MHCNFSQYPQYFQYSIFNTGFFNIDFIQYGGPIEYWVPNTPLTATAAVAITYNKLVVMLKSRKGQSSLNCRVTFSGALPLLKYPLGPVMWPRGWRDYSLIIINFRLSSPRQFSLKLIIIKEHLEGSAPEATTAQPPALFFMRHNSRVHNTHLPLKWDLFLIK